MKLTKDQYNILANATNTLLKLVALYTTKHTTPPPNPEDFKLIYPKNPQIKQILTANFGHTIICSAQEHNNKLHTKIIPADTITPKFTMCEGTSIHDVAQKTQDLIIKLNINDNTKVLYQPEFNDSFFARQELAKSYPTFLDLLKLIHKHNTELIP